MSAKRDFPATSIGRSQGSRIQHGQPIPSEAHPLLGSSSSPSHSPHSPSNSSSSPSHPPSSGGGGGGAKYKPYTPRQRAPQAAATTTTVHPPSPSQQHVGGDTATATSKLQMMHLKAAAQTVGLDTGTLGWVMLERILDSEVSSGTGGKKEKEQEEWAEVWSLLTSSKATLLLPLSSHEKINITPELLRDHIILCDGPGRKNGQFITLSGIRGTLSESQLTILTTLPRTSKPFSALLSLTPSTAGSTPSVSQLPPLPNPSTPFPNVELVSYTASLPLPPRHLQPQTKPPLPPRPARPANNATPASRIPNPFASLFGTKHTSTPSTSSVSTPALAPAPASPPASLQSLDSAEMPAPVVVDVPAYTIPHPLRQQELARDVVESVHRAVELGLGDVPGWVKERVGEFVGELVPFVKTKSTPPLAGKEKGEKGEKEKDTEWTPNAFFEPPEEIAGRLQDLYVALEEELRVWVRENAQEEEEEEGEKEEEEVIDMDEKEREFMRLEQRVRDVLESVERVVCEVFYDRLFMQPNTDDSSHDEALSSHIAALNMLDLTLSHLDVEVPARAIKGVNDLVGKCGLVLEKLERARCPREKAGVLVEAHKVVVEGLSKLPPIRLKSEDEKAAASADKEKDKEKGEFDDDLPTARPFIVTKEVEMEAKMLGGETVSSPIDSGGGGGLLAAPAPSSPLSIPRPRSPGGSEGRRPSALSLSLSPVHSPLHSPLHSPHHLPSESEIEPQQQQESTPVSGDVLLPLIIFSVVKANPPHLVSHLLFTQRFRNASVGGEQSYCLINMMAVAEFLENVDLEALGLGGGVVSTADLTPILLPRSPVTSETPLAPAGGGDANSLRGRMEQQVDAIADSANKVISGVVDSSFGILRSFSFLPGTTPTDSAVMEGGKPGSAPGPGLGLLRRESGFSIASIAASLPGRRATGGGEESGQMLLPVSRPGSVKARSRAGSVASGLQIRVGGESEEGESDGTEESVEEEEGEEEGEEQEGGEGKSVRSIRSFESMMSASRERRERREREGASASAFRGKGEKKGKEGEREREREGRKSGTKPITIGTGIQRKSLSDRLAHMSQSALAGFKNSSQLQPDTESTSPSSSRPSSPAPAPQPLRLAPPIQRFVECTPEELKLGEIGNLLADYKRLVEGVRSVGGFVDD